MRTVRGPALFLAFTALLGDPSPLLIKLPFAAKSTFNCTQGNHGKLTHSGDSEYAFDFWLREGTPVHAAAAGRVLVARDGWTQNAFGREMSAHGNYVWIDHGGGRFTLYSHLLSDSLRVREGELVNGGQRIALSGNTGVTTGAHLHFGVTDRDCRTVPCRFVDVAGDGIPVAGKDYRSGNDGTGMSWFTEDSRLSLDAFVADGVLLRSADVAVHFEEERTYVFRGAVTGSQSSVRLFFTPLGYPYAVAGRSYPVGEGGTFEIAFRPAEFAALRRAGDRFAYGISPEQGGQYGCKQMVRMTRWRDETDAHGEACVHLGMPFERDRTFRYARVGSTGERDSTIVVFMPSHTSVFACAAGRVVTLGTEEGDSSRGDPRTSFLTIDHGDGVLTEYLGLVSGSVPVRLGEIVQGGARVGSSFRSEWVEDHHLALRVREVSSRRARFDDVDGGRLDVDGEVSSTEAGSQRHMFRQDSRLDPEAFARAGVHGVHGLPLATFHVDTPYELEASVDMPMRELAFLVRRRGETCAASSISMRIAGGRVGCRLILSEAARELGRGTFEWTLATSDGATSPAFAVWLPFQLMR